MKKTLLIMVATVACLTLAFAVPSFAEVTQGPPGYYQKAHGHTAGTIKYFKNGHPENQSEWVFLYEKPDTNGCGGACGDAFADANAGATVGAPSFSVDLHDVTGAAVVDLDNKPNGWSAAGGAFTLDASATGTGKDRYFLWWKIKDGKAIAVVDITNTTLTTHALVFTSGDKLGGTGGLAYSYVKGIAILDVNASAYATGNKGCLQIASVSLSGDLSVVAGGSATVLGPNGSYSQTVGKGMTTAGIEGSDFDSGTYGVKWVWIFPIPTDYEAQAELNGMVIGTQDLFVKAYVSPDGMTTVNFGVVSGGSVIALGDISLTGDVTASGVVGQEAQAVGGGAVVTGSSLASYNNAGGTVSGRCLPVAQGDGLAVVTGYNNITNTGNQLTINSHQSAFATTK